MFVVCCVSCKVNESDLVLALFDREEYDVLWFYVAVSDAEFTELNEMFDEDFKHVNDIFFSPLESHHEGLMMYFIQSGLSSFESQF